MTAPTTSNISNDLKQLLLEYQAYEIDLMQKEVATGAPQPEQHHFSFARFFNWLNDLEQL